MDIPRPLPHKVEARAPRCNGGAGAFRWQSTYLAYRYKIGLLPSEFV